MEALHERQAQRVKRNSKIHNLPMTGSGNGSVWILFHYGGPPGCGRFERQCELAQALADGGFAVTVFYASFHHLLGSVIDGPPVPEHEYRESGHVRYLPVRCRKYSGNGVRRVLNMADFVLGVVIRAIRWRLRGRRVRCVIASSPHPFCWIGAVCARWLHGCRAIFEVRDIWPDSLIELGVAHASHPFVSAVRSIVRHAYRKADGIVFVMERGAEHLCSLGIGREARSIAIIGNGVSAEVVTGRAGHYVVPVSIGRIIERNRESGRFLFAYAGAMGPPNALHHLIYLRRWLSRERPGQVPGYHFIVMGDGPSREELLAELDAPGVDLFSVVDSVPKEVVPSVLRRVDAAVVFWNDAEVYRFGVSPNKLWEYLALGLPVLWVGGLGGMLVHEGKVGLVVGGGDPAGFDAAARSLAEMEPSEIEGMRESCKLLQNSKGEWSELGKEYRRFVVEIVE